MRTKTTGNNTKEARAAKTLWNLKFDIPELFSRTRSHSLEKLLGMKSTLSRMGATAIQERQGPDKRREKNRTKKLQKTNYRVLEHYVESVHKGAL